jgi:hypothetical protein
MDKVTVLDRVVVLKQLCRLTELDLLQDILHPMDVGASFLGHESYVWYYVLGQHYRPKTLVEIGTRFGYSLRSMIYGSGQPVEAWCYDNEYDHEGSLQYVENFFRSRLPYSRFHPHRVNTRDLNSLGIPAEVDLAHVDAEHTERGSYEDCLLVRPYVRPGGVILVDDVGGEDGKHVKAGADRFCEEFGLQPVFLDNYRGVYLIHL